MFSRHKLLAGLQKACEKRPISSQDIEEMANKIAAVLKYPPLQLTLREHGNFEVRRLRWQDAAEKCARAYSDVMVHV